MKVCLNNTIRSNKQSNFITLNPAMCTMCIGIISPFKRQRTHYRKINDLRSLLAACCAKCHEGGAKKIR